MNTPKRMKKAKRERQQKAYRDIRAKNRKSLEDAAKAEGLPMDVYLMKQLLDRMP